MANQVRVPSYDGTAVSWMLVLGGPLVDVYVNRAYSVGNGWRARVNGLTP